jgi:hypothetical protein
MPVAPTADLSLPVIAFGTQPFTQLSLDYPMHENYGGNLAVKAGDGTWTHGQGGDGRFRNGKKINDDAVSTPFLANQMPFCHSKPISCQDRLGTTIKKTQNQTAAFLQESPLNQSATAQAWHPTGVLQVSQGRRRSF